MVIVTNQVENVVTTLLGVRMLILGLLMYCDSFKKIIFKKTIAKLMGNIQEPVCSLIGTAFSRHHGQNLFTYFLSQFGRSFNCLNFWGAEIYVAMKGTF